MAKSEVKYYVQTNSIRYTPEHVRATIAAIDTYDEYYDEDEYVEINNASFETDVTIVEFYNGRSSAGVMVTVNHPEIEGLLYCNLTIGDLVKALKGAPMCQKGVFPATCRFKKRGQRYLLEIIDQPKE